MVIINVVHFLLPCKARSGPIEMRPNHNENVSRPLYRFRKTASPDPVRRGTSLFSCHRLTRCSGSGPYPLQSPLRLLRQVASGMLLRI